MKKFLVLLSVGLLLACNPSNNSFFETINPSKWNKTTIDVKWVSAGRIDDVCKGLGANDGPPSGGKYTACARSKPDDINVCEIYAVEPNSFDDNNGLATFGHEVWHCLGAKHK